MFYNIFVLVNRLMKLLKMYTLLYLSLFSGILALSLLSSENTIYSLLLFVLIIITGVIGLFNAQVEYLSYIFLLIYLGAISVLFAFAIALLGLGTSGIFLSHRQTAEADINLIIALKAMLSTVYCTLTLQDCFETSTFTNSSFTVEYRWDDLQALAILFCINNFQLIMIALVLLLSMVGSIGLCLQQ